MAAYVVQVNANASAEQLRSLRLRGLRADRDNDFASRGRIYRMTEEQREVVVALPFVVSVERLRPRDKLDAEAVAAAGDPLTVTIDTFDHLGDAQREQVAHFLKQHGAVIRWVSRATLRAQVAKKLVYELAALDAVVWIEPTATTNGPK